jgi:hypothetical protein
MIKSVQFVPKHYPTKQAELCLASLLELSPPGLWTKIWTTKGLYREDQGLDQARMTIPDMHSGKWEPAMP